VDVPSLFPAAPSLQIAPTIHWEYKLLRDIEILGHADDRFARLICEEDEGGEMFVHTCTSADFRHLEPYAAELQAWKSDPLEHEIPLIPISYDDHGAARFCTEAAELDHPSMHECRTTLPLAASLAHQIRKAAKARAMTGAELVMSLLLKSATKTG